MLLIARLNVFSLLITVNCEDPPLKSGFTQADIVRLVIFLVAFTFSFRYPSPVRLREVVLEEFSMSVFPISVEFF